jgi:transcriptional regulator GlxA family with amidase domain
MPDVSRARACIDLETIRAMSWECEYNSTALARCMGISARQLQRLFKRYLCCSPRTWLREERLQLAREMLLDSASVKEVALKLSFRQASQFCRDFRSRFGYTPTEHKKFQGTRYSEGFAVRQGRAPQG